MTTTAVEEPASTSVAGRPTVTAASARDPSNEVSGVGALGSGTGGGTGGGAAAAEASETVQPARLRNPMSSRRAADELPMSSR